MQERWMPKSIPFGACFPLPRPVLLDYTINGIITRRGGQQAIRPVKNYEEAGDHGRFQVSAGNVI